VQSPRDNNILYKILIKTKKPNNNRYIKNIIKLGHKNNKTYGRIVINKDIAISSIIIFKRRGRWGEFWCSSHDQFFLQRRPRANRLWWSDCRIIKMC
jgi:hypothetical protein